jgi:hypothetical protein
MCPVNNTGKVNIFLDFSIRLSWLEWFHCFLSSDDFGWGYAVCCVLKLLWSKFRKARSVCIIYIFYVCLAAFCFALSTCGTHGCLAWIIILISLEWQCSVYCSHYGYKKESMSEMNTSRKFLLFSTCGDKRIRTFLWVACKKGWWHLRGVGLSRR